MAQAGNGESVTRAGGAHLSRLFAGSCLQRSDRPPRAAGCRETDSQIHQITPRREVKPMTGVVWHPVTHSPTDACHACARRSHRPTRIPNKRMARMTRTEKPPITGLPRAAIGTTLERRTGCPAPGDPVSLTLNRDDSAAHSDSTLCMVLSGVALPVPMFWSKVTELA